MTRLQGKLCISEPHGRYAAHSVDSAQKALMVRTKQFGPGLSGLNRVQPTAPAMPINKAARTK